VIIVVQLVPKLPLEVLETRLQVITRLCQLNLVKILLQLLVLIQFYRLKYMPCRSTPLPVIKMHRLKRVQLRKPQLREYNVLPVYPAFHLQKLWTDFIN